MRRGKGRVLHHMVQSWPELSREGSCPFPQTRKAEPCKKHLDGLFLSGMAGVAPSRRWHKVQAEAAGPVAAEMAAGV